MSISSKINHFQSILPSDVQLVAVSKTYPSDVVMQAYDASQRIFGENRPQEMVQKYEQLPKDIEWHMIGHLQTNKVKYIASFVKLIHSVDSVKLLEVINKEAEKNNRVIDVLLEVHVAQEDTKYGWNEGELVHLLNNGGHTSLSNIRFRGMMGIATNTDDEKVIKDEFLHLKAIFDTLGHDFFDNNFDTLSMGMSSDYPIAIECGSNMVRIGSAIFGERDYSK